jgi:hypothetical protein
LNEIGVKKSVIIIVIQNEREMTKKLVRIRGKKGSQMEGDGMVQNSFWYVIYMNTFIIKRDTG